MLLVLGQNWHHVLLCKEVKGDRNALHGVFANQNGGILLRVDYSAHIIPIEPCGMALYARDYWSLFRQSRLYI
jgi:hypothetical protein